MPEPSGGREKPARSAILATFTVFSVDNEQRNPSMIPIPYLASALFTGEEAADFLQAQLTADIDALEDGAATFACYCTPKGQVLGLLRVERAGDAYRVTGAADLMPGILQRLRMFVFRTRVAFEPADDLVAYGVPGPDYRLAPAGRGEDGDIAAWKARELRAGIAWLGVGSAEKFIPQMLGFDALGAVSFSKGCYPGQEIVARARFLGTVKRKPLVLDVEAAIEPAAGDKFRVRRGEVWSDCVVVDHATTDGSTVVFTVARADSEAPASEVESGGVSYRCATI
jgi:folate-binding protein YgfZ